MKEKFKFFKDSKKTKYYVSNFGKVKSICKKTNKEKILLLPAQKTCKWDKIGYLCFGIHTNGTVKTYRVHKIVAELFIKKNNKNNIKLDINHIDGNKHNNNSKNLEYLSRKENMIHAYSLNLIKKPDLKREKNPFFNRFKHDLSLLKLAINEINNGKSTALVARELNIDYRYLWAIYKKREDICAR